VRTPRAWRFVVSFVAAVGTVFAMAAPAYAAGDNYVALGDSYSSGVGADNYISDGTSCSRSYNAYPYLWASSHAPASFKFLACSGAKTGDVLNNQLGGLSSSTTLVSITIGGNDAGFSNIMTQCVLYGTTECVAAVNSAETFARNTLPGLLNNTYNQIRSHAPNARVVVLSYPVFYQLNTFCVGLSDTSRAKIDEGINLLDDITRTAVSSHPNFRFADVRSVFVGHQLCSGDKWLHALNWLDMGVSYHPFDTGHRYGYLPVFTNNAG